MKQDEKIAEAIRLLEENGYRVIPPEPADVTDNLFELAWKLYDKKVGCKEKLLKKWLQIPRKERFRILDYIPRYVAATPDKQYRKNFQTFLNQKAWNDEIIIHSSNDTTQDRLGKAAENVAAIAGRF